MVVSKSTLTGLLLVATLPSCLSGDRRRGRNGTVPEPKFTAANKRPHTAGRRARVSCNAALAVRRASAGVHGTPVIVDLISLAAVSLVITDERPRRRVLLSPALLPRPPAAPSHTPTTTTPSLHASSCIIAGEHWMSVARERNTEACGVYSMRTPGGQARRVFKGARGRRDVHEM